MQHIIIPSPITHHFLLSIEIYFSELGIARIDYSQASAVEIKQLEKQNQVQFSPSEIQYTNDIQQQIHHYWADPTFEFSLDYQWLLATDFQQRVWQVLQSIPCGQVRTYGSIAKQLNTSARAVGNACRHNLFPLTIPCHRIVSVSGMGGYAGDSIDKQKGEIDFLAVKQWLLTHEQNNDE